MTGPEPFLLCLLDGEGAPCAFLGRPGEGLETLDPGSGLVCEGDPNGEKNLLRLKVDE